MSVSMSSVCISVGVVSYLNNMCRDMLKDVCARNGLDYEDECRKSGISEGLVVVSEEEIVSQKKMSKSSKSVVKSQGEKVVVEGEKVVVLKSYKGSSFPLPFVGIENKDCCGGLKHNEGLMTQCRVQKKGADDYCKTCKNQADKNGTGMPTYGCIKGRMEGDIYEYTAPNGEHVSTYSSVMLKYNLSEEMVLAEASKMNMVIDSRHFEKVEVSTVKKGRPKADKKEENSSTDGSSKRGRPKHAPKVIELEGDDLFAALVANQEQVVPIVENVVAVQEVAAIVVPEVAVVKKKVVVDKEAKKKEKKALEEAKKALEEAASKAEEEALKAILLKKEEVAEEEEAEVEDKVSPITVEGKKYLKSTKSGVVYDVDSHEEVGEWNSKSNNIDFYEEEEEEYEEE